LVRGTTYGALLLPNVDTDEQEPKGTEPIRGQRGNILLKYQEKLGERQNGAGNFTARRLMSV